MSNFNDKINKSIADAVTKIMNTEQTHPKTEKEKDLAAMAHPKDKITHKDVLVGRGVLKKEEKESCEDEVEEHEKKMHGKKGEVAKHEKSMHKEETEQLQEYQSKDGVYKHKGTYGTAKGAEYGETDWDKENKDAKDMTKPKASRKLGPRQNYVRATRVNESFTQMIAAYQEKGLKALAEMSPVEEEVDSETYEKEMKDQKDKFDGKKKGADVAKASVQAVKQEETHKEIQVIDMTDPDNIKKETISIEEAKKMKGEDPCWDSHEMVGMKMKNGKKVPNCVPKNEEVEQVEERTLTEPEAKKKEEIVKSMKKKMSGFKERYGERAKSVAYATATKIAKEKA
jgi:hypothetical protein